MFNKDIVKAVFEPSLPFVTFEFPSEEGQELNPRKQLVLDWLIPDTQRYFRTPQAQADVYNGLMAFIRRFIEGPVSYGEMAMSEILKNIGYFNLIAMSFQHLFQHGDKCWVLNEPQGNNQSFFPGARTIVHRMARQAIVAAHDSNSDFDEGVFYFLTGSIPSTKENLGILLDGLDEFANAPWQPLPANA